MLARCALALLALVVAAAMAGCQSTPPATPKPKYFSDQHLDQFSVAVKRFENNSKRLTSNCSDRDRRCRVAVINANAANLEGFARDLSRLAAQVSGSCQLQLRQTATLLRSQGALARRLAIDLRQDQEARGEKTLRQFRGNSPRVKQGLSTIGDVCLGDLGRPTP